LIDIFTGDYFAARRYPAKLRALILTDDHAGAPTYPP
jgi:hypothetical protein